MTVIWSVPASNEFDEITDYILQQSPHNATLVLERITAAARLLGGAPNMGRSGRVRGTRELFVPRTSYVITYRIETDRVLIVGVQRAAKSWPRSFHA